MINNVVKILKQGGIVALPTETVYGLAVDMMDKTAIKKLYDLKKRDKKKPLAIAISNVVELKKIVTGIPQKASMLIKKFWPGPLTIVFKASENIPRCLGLNGKIGIRNPNNKKTLEIIRKLGNPIALTSANISGQKSCINANEVKNVFDDSIDVIVESREKNYGLESTVVDVTAPEIKILRKGCISKNDIDVCLHRK